MANYSRLDDNGLLFLLQQLKAKIDASVITIINFKIRRYYIKTKTNPHPY